MTKERIEYTIARLDRLGSGKDDKDTVDAQESKRRADLFTLVAWAHRSILRSLHYSTLDETRDSLQEVLDRAGAVDYVENDEDRQTVSNLVDDIRDAVIEYQVSAILGPPL